LQDIKQSERLVNYVLTQLLADKCAVTQCHWRSLLT